MTEQDRTSRREFLKKGVMAAALVPLLRLDVPDARAADKVPPTDPVAMSLKYVEDASEAERPDKAGTPGEQQFCSNCSLYSAVDEEGWGGCALFQQRLVAADGWCAAWILKG